MNRRTFCAILPVADALRPAEAASQQQPPPRERLLFDHDWRFLMGDSSGAESTSYDAGFDREEVRSHDQAPALCEELLSGGLPPSLGRWLNPVPRQDLGDRAVAHLASQIGAPWVFRLLVLIMSFEIVHLVHRCVIGIG